jgi:hypothetical protein
MKAIRIICYEGDEEWLLRTLNNQRHIDKKGIGEKELGKGRSIREGRCIVINDKAKQGD